MATFWIITYVYQLIIAYVWFIKLLEIVQKKKKKVERKSFYLKEKKKVRDI